MYYKFIMYNGNIYSKSRNIFTKKDCFVTQFKEKTDDSFYEYLDYLDRYARDIENDDVYDLYEVEFSISYNDTGKATEEEHWWNVDEAGAYRLPAKIENDEVSIFSTHDEYKYAEDWTALKTEPGGFYMEGWYAKIVNIHDCAKLRVRYVYKVFEGQYISYPAEKVVEVIMEPEAFKAEMLKYRLSNI